MKTQLYLHADQYAGRELRFADPELAQMQSVLTDLADTCGREPYRGVRFRPARIAELTDWNLPVTLIDEYRARRPGAWATVAYPESGPSIEMDVPDECVDSLRERIAAIDQAIEGAVRTPQTHPCAGRPDGCMERVLRLGMYCPRCQHDSD